MNQESENAERYPTLTDAGREMLRFLQEQPHAPKYRNQSGNRLLPSDILEYQRFEQEVLDSRISWRPREVPDFALERAEACYRSVPHFRKRGTRPKHFEDIPPTRRGDLSRDIAPFVPDELPLDRVINFSTTGLTGEPLLLPSHPVVPAKYLALLKKALRYRSIELSHSRGQVGVVLVGYQRPCFTYVSVTPMMGESGLAKINLDLEDWNEPEDRERYLDALNPEIYTGDPIGFAALASLPLRTRPRAMISTSMTLLEGFRQQLESHFGCPVLDIYSMNEAGTISVADGPGHRLLQPSLYVEILDEEGNVLPAGTRGEVTLTGGFNHYLPLLRYRTGDFAALEQIRGEPVLLGLEGRPPVMYQDHAGQWFNNINVTHQLKRFPISQFCLHQHRDRSVTVKIRDERLSAEQIHDALEQLFGTGIRIDVQLGAAFRDKVIQCTSELPQSWANLGQAR